jgi:serine/threonine-protein kinase
VTAEQQEAARIREQVQAAEKAAAQAKTQADATQAGSAAQLRQIYERAGAAGALLDARREQQAEHERKASVKEAQARDLRRQIEELRAQLSRYAEALEEDLASGREKVAARTREGLAFEKSFSDVSGLLLNHLKAKPEARDLLQELMSNMQSGVNYAVPKASGPESRGP